MTSVYVTMLLYCSAHQLMSKNFISFWCSYSSIRAACSRFEYLQNPRSSTPFRRHIIGGCVWPLLWLSKIDDTTSHPLQAKCRADIEAWGLTSLSSSLFSFLTQHFFTFSCLKLSATLQMSSRRDCMKMCAIISIFKQCLPRPHYSRHFTPPSCAAIQNS